jgi:glutamate/tyrosine decarboxylase-like PLP-dependent enzyme
VSPSVRVRALLAAESEHAGMLSFDEQLLASLGESLRELERGFIDLPRFDAELDEREIAAARAILLEVAARLRDNFPYPHPLYAGQMLKPPHPLARSAYQLAQWINPNNHALDGGRASSAMEKEAVAEIARMLGWKTHLGHLTGGGTMANLEALWIAGKLHPGRTIVASSQAHYTHARISQVLGLAFEEIAVDARGRMSTAALARRLERGDVGTIVATMGTTSTGSVDPLRAVLDLASKRDARVHADAAYGGYYALVDELEPDARDAFAALERVDSIVIDPHKHGLQPYGCGSVLFRDAQVGAFYKHESPYTYFSSAELHLGEISLECSRAGAAAVALWATQRLFPLERGGTFARRLARSRRAALELFAAIDRDERWRTIFEPELDIVVWAPRAATASATSRRTQAIFEASAREGLHLAVARLPRSLLAESNDAWRDLEWDADSVACLRSCLMKPEHLDWIDAIVAILDRTASADRV